MFAALAQGAIDTLIIWEDLDLIRVSVKNSETGEIEYRHLTPAQRKANDVIATPEGVVCEFQDEELLTEYFAEHYREYGCKLEFISDKSEEGSQFCKGFGGIGGEREGCLGWVFSSKQESCVTRWTFSTATWPERERRRTLTTASFE